MINDVCVMRFTTADYKSIALPAELQGLLFSCLIFSSKIQINQCKESQVSSQSADCSRSNVTGCRPFVTDLSLNEYHMKQNGIKVKTSNYSYYLDEKKY